MRVDQLLCDVVEEVPASISEGALQERQRDQTYVVIPEGLKSMRWLQPVVVACGIKRKVTFKLKEIKKVVNTPV